MSFTCIFCCGLVPRKYNRSNKQNKSEDEIPESVKSELDSFFVVRRLLRLEDEVCFDLLRKWGRPASWEVELCVSCKICVEATRQILEQIAMLEKKFEKSKLELENKIVVSDAKNSEDNSLHKRRLNKGKDLKKSAAQFIRESVIERSKRSSLPQHAVKTEVSSEDDEDGFDCFSLSCVDEKWEDESVGLSPKSSPTSRASSKKEASTPSGNPVQDTKLPEKVIIRVTRGNKKSITVKESPKSSTLSSVNHKDLKTSTDVDKLCKELGNEVKNSQWDVSDEDIAEFCEVPDAHSSDLGDTETHEDDSESLECVPDYDGVGNEDYEPDNGEGVDYVPEDEGDEDESDDVSSISSEEYTPRPKNKRISTPTNSTSKSHKKINLFLNCSDCESILPNQFDLELHLRIEHSKFYCPECKTTQDTWEELNMHTMNEHRALTSRYLCTHCPQRYTKKCRLKKHLKTIHRDDEPFPYRNFKRTQTTECPDCGKPFDNASSLASHYRLVHPTEAQRTCKYCHQVFSTMGVYMTHLRTNHDTEKNHMCEICSKTFYEPRQLFAHQYSVHDVPLPEHLAYSVQIVTQEGLKCVKCDKTFKNANTLASHNRLVHPTEEQKICKYCKEKFESMTKLMTHIKMDHQMDKHHMCEMCSKTFSEERLMFAHQNKEHGVPFPANLVDPKRKCVECGKLFSAAKTLARHMLTIHAIPEKNFECPRTGCEFRAFSEAEVKIHVTYVHDKVQRPKRPKRECPECGKLLAGNTSRDLHLRFVHGRTDVQVKVLQFPCNHCPKTYNQKRNLLLHLNRVHGEDNDVSMYQPRKPEKPRNRKKKNLVGFNEEYRDHELLGM